MDILNPIQVLYSYKTVIDYTFSASCLPCTSYTSDSAPTRLKQQLEGSGYVNCTQQDFNSFGMPENLRKTCGTMLVAAGAQSLHGIVDAGGSDGLQTHEEVDELMNALHKDNEKGDVNVGWTITWIIGQNPE